MTVFLSDRKRGVVMFNVRLWFFFGVLLTMPLVATYLGSPAQADAAPEEAVVIELTQTPCTMVEAEEKPMRFISSSPKDCKRINRETAGERRFKALNLKAGSYIFRVTNRDVPYDLGFWLRGKGVGRLTLPSVSGGGLGEGETRDYVVDLVPGRYLYSCPLNPTPDYPLVVK